MNIRREAGFWSAAACCRFSPSQPAGHRELPISLDEGQTILPGEARACSRRKSGGKPPNSKPS
jgi:hypothetical protein